MKNKKKQKIAKGEAFIIDKNSADGLFLVCEGMATARSAINYFASKYRVSGLRLYNILKKKYPGIEQYAIAVENIEEGKHVVEIGKKLKK